MLAILQIDDTSDRSRMRLDSRGDGPCSRVPEDEAAAAVIATRGQENLVGPILHGG